jgi:hypothetical protein
MRKLSALEFRKRLAPHHASGMAREFEIDGRLLQEHLELASGRAIQEVSPLGWTTREYEERFVRRLLARAAPLLPEGRDALLVCPLCADTGCGCVSAEIVVTEECVTWRQLGTENDYDPDSLKLFDYVSFCFDREAYEALLRPFA